VAAACAVIDRSGPSRNLAARLGCNILRRLLGAAAGV
jgi:hypothetical protein